MFEGQIMINRKDNGKMVIIVGIYFIGWSIVVWFLGDLTIFIGLLLIGSIFTYLGWRVCNTSEHEENIIDKILAISVFIVIIIMIILKLNS